MTHLRLDRATETKGVDMARDCFLSGRDFGETRAKVARVLGIPTRTAHRLTDIGQSVARHILRARAPELVGGAERLADLEAA